MTRSVFFSFDYDDVWRANQVRESDTFAGVKRSGFRDKAQFEQIKQKGEDEIRKWIRGQMHGCSVTCVLIGVNTHKRRWVSFEIKESIDKGMGLLGVYLHKLEDEKGAVLDLPDQPPNPLDCHIVPSKNWIQGEASKFASAQFETYVWQPAESIFAHQNELGVWVEEAANRTVR